MRTPISVHASDPHRHVQPPFREWPSATFPPAHTPWPRRRARMLRRPFRVATRAVTAAVALGLGWTTSGPATADDTGGQRDRLRRTPVVEVFEATHNAVVNISATQVIEQVRAPRGIGALFDEFFPLPRVRRYQSESVGSGFVLHPDGYIVTNYHVVARTAERKVIFADNRQFDAEVVATDMPRDLAVLKIDASGPLQPLPLGRSHDLMVGETVIAIGNPLGYQHTVTAGVVSALDRQIDVGRRFQFTNLIQTDASINPGNSGGPLLNVLGELIGITTAIRADAENIGFAIPVDGLREVLPEMLAVERRYGFTLGITVANVKEATVTGIRHRSPADEAGIQVGDIVRRVAEDAVESSIDYHIALIGRRSGETIALHLDREGRPFNVAVTLADPPRPDGAALLRQHFGLEAEPMNVRMAEQLGFRRPTGLVIVHIEPGGPADQAGLQRGQVILHLGRFQVRTLNDIGSLLSGVATGQRVAGDVLQIGRGRLIRQIVTLTAR